MKFYARLRDAFDGFPHGAHCDVCDAEIVSDDPVYLDFDADVDVYGRPYDCSTYVCKTCGQTCKEKEEEQS